MESPTAICAPVSLGSINPLFFQASANAEESKARERRKYEDVEDDTQAFLSPDLPGAEPPPPPDNIAFMITNTKVQALSTGEYQELVNAKRGNVQTVTVGKQPRAKNGCDIVSGGVNGSGPDHLTNSGFSKKPVIIVFDEPMDIRSAYKRLSTVFECEEELERMLAEERIEEENEDEEERGEQEKGNKTDSVKPSEETNSFFITKDPCNISSPPLSSDTDTKQDAKKRFKFKFPKKQLAALTQAIRAGTKTGKKTLQVVVYEDEEETDGTVKQHKETKRFEIARSKQETSTSESSPQESLGRTAEIRKSAYKTLDSLEQTIKQLETTICQMGPKSSEELQPPQGSQGGEASDKGVLQDTLVHKPRISSKSSGLRKKPKPQLLPRPATIPTAGVSITPAPTQKVSLQL